MNAGYRSLVTTPFAAHWDAGGIALESLLPMDHVRFEALYRAHYRDVFRYVLVLTRHQEDAEDITAETFERAYRAWTETGDPTGEPLPWLLLTARRRVTDRWRRVRRFLHQRLTPAEDVGAEPPSDDWLWLNQLATVLPARQREVLLLKYHRDLSDANIGVVMGLTQSGVRSLAARAIANLRRHPEVWE